VIFISKKPEISLEFAGQAARNPDLVRLLFIVTIDLSKSTAPFASTHNVNYIRGVDEVLFFDAYRISYQSVEMIVSSR